MSEILTPYMRQRAAEITVTLNFSGAEIAALLEGPELSRRTYAKSHSRDYNAAMTKLREALPVSMTFEHFHRESSHELV